MPRRVSVPNTHAADAYRLGRWFTSIRREGLLALLRPEDWHTLSAVLSFTSRDGTRAFTLDQLGVALALPRDTARARLDALAAVQWQGKSLATVERDPRSEVIGARIAPLEVLSQIQSPGASPGAANVPVVSSPENSKLAADLTDVGLNPAQVEWLIKRFPPARIRRQLNWLPQREARNPAAMLIRAVEQDWDGPKEAS